jgi:hypothetical protein
MTLFKWGKRLIEIWFVPRNYEIPRHSHPSEDIELMFIFGDAIFCRMVDSEKFIHSKHVTLKNIFSTFTVKAGTIHWFHSRHKLPLIFINFSKWSTTPTSASVDFKPV